MRPESFFEDHKAQAMITTRRATIDDLDALLRFEQSVVEAERPFDTTLKDGVLHYYDLAKLISSADAEVIVAETDGEIIGSGYARVEPSKPYLKHQKHSYLGFMYVVPAFRGQGVNKMIVEALEAWSISKGITEMRLEVYSQNAAAIRAYEKAGYTGHMLAMRKGLSDN